MDVKRTYCGNTPSNRYCGPAQNEQSGAVNRRQVAVHVESHAAARKVDIEFNDFDPQNGGMGPVQSALDAYGRVEGWVLGAFGEASSDVHELAKRLGDIGGSRGFRDMGAATPGEASAVLAQRARRVLGIEAVRGHARLKLDRLASMTGDADAGAGRRSRSRFGARSNRNAYFNARGPRVFRRNCSHHSEW